MADNRFEFRYTANDVASAQRMRLIHSKQMRIMLGIWLVSSLFMAVPLLLPGLFPDLTWLNWGLVLEIALIYLVTMVILFALTPYLDFFFNRFWRLPLLFQFSDKQMRLSVVGGKSKGLHLTWAQIQRAEENARVFILYYGSGSKFIILPKAIFKRPQDDKRFRGLLRRRFEMPAAPVEAPEALEEEQP